MLARVEKLRGVPGHVVEYPARWVGSGPTADHLEKLCADVYRSLATVIESELDRALETDSLDYEIAATGMCRGEVLGVRWKDVDFEGMRLSVRQAVVAGRGGVRVVEPKNGKARVIDLDAGTIVKLVEHRERQEAEKAEWGSGYQDEGLVFCRENGTPLSPYGLTNVFKRLSVEAGLPETRFHDLRHTHATVAIAAGVPVKVIAERLGHFSPGFTLAQYAHVLPGMQAEAASQVAALVGVGG